MIFYTSCGGKGECFPSQLDGHPLPPKKTQTVTGVPYRHTTYLPRTLEKIVKLVATGSQILRQKCTKFDFGWGYASDPIGGAYSTPRPPIAEFRGPTSKGEREGREGKRRRNLTYTEGDVGGRGRFETG